MHASLHPRTPTMPTSSLPGAIGANPDFLISLSLRNACLAFFDDRHTRFRATFVSLEGVEAMVHGFSEYQYGYQRLTTVRAAKPGDSPLLARCHHRHLGLGVPYSCNNVFHQLFHAEVAALPVSGCGGGSTDAKLACNITVNIESVRLAVNRAAAYTAWGS
ncbi:hypothetical protein AB1Y20_020783 [Prymnesium parvum]|uniref:Uncharacterized protein n=1 Tax=Prymnesium parvum TaxID=97485 RepID=A0AB34JYF1_PRYPA